MVPSPSLVPVILATTWVLGALSGSLERSARPFMASTALELPAASSLYAWLETKSANVVVVLVASQVVALFCWSKQVASSSFPCQDSARANPENTANKANNGTLLRILLFLPLIGKLSNDAWPHYEHLAY